MTTPSTGDTAGAVAQREVKPWGWHSGDGTPAHPADKVERWPDHNRKRMTEPVYGTAAMDAAISNALDAREFEHAESSRIYARLASAVRSGCEDEALARVLREEVNKRTADR